MIITMEFSSIILEHILSFLPVETMGILPQVRQSWNVEMGSSSLTLWKSLLHRKKYLMFKEQHEAGREEESARDRYRTLFLSNYEMANRIEWMVKAWKTSGQDANYQRHVTEYSHGTIITSGYIHNYCFPSLDDERDDGTIAVDHSNFTEDASEFYLTCFEIHQSRGLQKSVNVRSAPNPFPRHLKKYWRAISCDEDIICCVFAADEIAKIVTVIYRDGLRSIWNDCGFSPINDEVVDTGEMQTFDMNEKFYQYCEENPQSAIFSGGLDTYLEVGGDLKDLALSIENICACGGGLFFFYARVCKQPAYEELRSGQYHWQFDNATGDIERVVGLFSITDSSIAFMELAPWKYLMSETMYWLNNSQTTTKIICEAWDDEDTKESIGNEEDYDIIMIDLNLEDQRVVITSLKNEFQNSRSVLTNQEWNEYNTNSRHFGRFVMAGHEVIIAEVLSCKVNVVDDRGKVGPEEKHKVVLSFLPLQESIDLEAAALDLEATTEKFPSHLSGNLTVYSMKVSGDHLILMYGCDEHDRNWGWGYSKSVGLVVVHIPTRKEVYSCSNLGDVEERRPEVPRLMTHTQNGEFIISFLHTNNDDMVMTSRNIRTTSTS